MDICYMGHKVLPDGHHADIRDVGEHPNGEYQIETEEPVASTPRSSRHTLEIETQITGTVIRPGDKIVVAFSRRLDTASRQEVIEEIESRLPGVSGVILDDVAALAVYREDKNSIHHPGNRHHHLLHETPRFANGGLVSSDAVPTDVDCDV